MSSLDQYLEAATRANTRRSYASALRHFEVEWGGHLPATPDSVARYLAEHAGQFANNTLRQRLAALAHWHREHGFVDPTRAPLVRKVLKGIQRLHPSVEKQAEPLQLSRLAQVDDWLTDAITAAQDCGAHADELRHRRDRALVLLGFWRGFRGDELIRVQVEHLRLVTGEGMTCFLPISKGDRQSQGNTYKVPALSRLCPVTATWEWIDAAGLTKGPLLRAVDRWGHVAEDSLHPNSLNPLLRHLLTAAGLPDAEEYSSHSLRRGFAGWANANGWDVKALMEYVGWRDVHSAMRYLDGGDPFSRQRIEASLPAPAAPALEPAQQLMVSLRLLLTPFARNGRGVTKARRRIEEICLAPFQMQRLNTEGTEYRLTMAPDPDRDLDEILATLLDDLHRMADTHQCFLEASLSSIDGRHWD
ncbi:site-specific integrase [Pseudomonas aeruginosa]|uniref:site-specific integrase n=1 Tax=Pseudomonas aeruginosa TaxID=287 RepID=UPI0034D17BC2